MLSHDQINKLVADWQAGPCQRLAGEIYRVMKRMIYKTAHARACGRPVVDDLSSIGAIALLQAMRTYDPSRGKFFSWARKRIQWAINNESRSLTLRARFDELDTDMRDDLEPADPSPSPESIAAWRTAFERVKAAVKPKRWDVVESRFFRDLTIQEAGERIGLTKQAAAYHERQAVEMLAKEMGLD